MNFNEAIDKLNEGAKITRKSWNDDVYFIKDGNVIHTYRQSLRFFIYTEDIMISDDWIIEGTESLHTFSSIIPLLQKGAHARLKSWTDSFIYLDGKDLVIHTMDVGSYIPTFSDFLANDWEIVK